MTENFNPKTTQKNEIVFETLDNNRCFTYDNPYTINLDKLVLNLSNPNNFNYSFIKENYIEVIQNLFQVNSNTLLRLIPDSEFTNKDYNRIFEIRISEIIVGNLYLDGKGIFQDSLKLQFNNRFLYSFNWYSYYQLISSSFEIYINNITSFEIAFDSYNKLEMFGECYENSSKLKRSYHEPTYKPVSRIVMNSLSDGKEFILGCKDSKKKIAIYNKTEDIKETRKDYITKFHSINGLDITKQIDRVELRIKNQYEKAYGFTYTDLTNQTGLLTIFKTMLEDSLNWYDLRSWNWIDGNKQFKRIEIIDFSGLKVNEVKPLPKEYESELKTYNRELIALKKFTHNFIETRKETDLQALLNYIDNPLNQIDTVKWHSDILIKKKIRQYANEYPKKCKVLTPEIIATIANIETLVYGINASEISNPEQAESIYLNETIEATREPETALELPPHYVPYKNNLSIEREKELFELWLDEPEPYRMVG